MEECVLEESRDLYSWRPKYIRALTGPPKVISEPFGEEPIGRFYRASSTDW